MAQSCTVMAFRKRLRSYGYTCIQIYKAECYVDVYDVVAIEPLGGVRISVRMSIAEMYNAFR